MMANDAIRRLERWERVGRVLEWLFVLLCLWIGGVMTIGMRYWEKPISREEAIPAEASYESCRASYSRSSLSEVQVRFSDLERKYLDSAYVTEPMYEAVRALEPGTRVSLQLHPNSSIILDFRVGDQVILDFDRAVEGLRREVLGFTVLGSFLLLFSLGLGAALLIPKKSRRKLRMIRSTAGAHPEGKSEAIRRVLRLYFQPLRELLLAGLGLSAAVLVLGLVLREKRLASPWTGALILLPFLLMSSKLLVFRLRVAWAFRSQKPQTRSIRVCAIEADEKLSFRRGVERHQKALLTDEEGNVYRFLSPVGLGSCPAAQDRKLRITFLPEVNLLLYVTPYLKPGEDKRTRKALRDLFVFYMTGQYEYEQSNRR